MGSTLDRRSELSLRVASALVMAAVALGATWAGGLWFRALWVVAGVAIAAEWMAMTRVEPRRMATGLAGAGILGFASAEMAGAGPALLAAVAGLAIGAVAIAGAGLRDKLWGVAGFGYAAVVALVPPALRERPGLGAVAVLWMFAVVWTTDVAAYFAGRRFGGPKLWPSVSPKKTWSGFAAGLVGGAAAATLLVALAAPDAIPGGLVAVALASAAASVASQLGDLGESAMKRRFAVKDSGRLIPGHGGVMDRLDGFAAVALLCGLALVGARSAGH
jgi:phosphatidate cytidylyltransferase